MGSYRTHVYYPRGVPAPAWALSAAWAGMGASKNVLSERAVMHRHGLPREGGSPSPEVLMECRDVALKDTV